MYEAKFIIGAIAGIMAENNKVGYLCDYPICGQIAGISAGVIEMICSQKLPNGVQRLVEFLKKSNSSGVYNPFIGPIYTQEETVIDADAEGLGYEDIIGMNWLLNNVVGIIPQYEQLNKNAKATVESAGIIL